jgi:hypothetical protein
MSSPKEAGRSSLSRPNVPLQPRLSSLSIEEGYIARSQTPLTSSPQHPSSPDLPASLALPLSRTRSSTPQSPVPLRGGPSVSVDDDSASIRSFVPTLAAGDDLEAMLSEMLGSDARWRIEQDDDLDVWDGQSDDDSDSDLDSNDENEDEGQSSSDCANDRG